MGTIQLQDIERLADQLPANQQLELVRHLTIQLSTAGAWPPSPRLEGSWKGFPDDFDIDAALKEIRS